MIYTLVLLSLYFVLVVAYLNRKPAEELTMLNILYFWSLYPGLCLVLYIASLTNPNLEDK